MNDAIQILASFGRRRSPVDSALDRIWESGDAPFQDGVDSLISLRRIGSASRPSHGNGNVVTSDDGSDGSDSASEDAEEAEEFVQDEDYEVSSHGVPAEVTLLESDYGGSHHDSHQDRESDSDLDVDESEEESEDEEENEEQDDGAIDEDDSAIEYETDQDSVESERSGQSSDDDMDKAFRRSARSEGSAGNDALRDHELFLPRNVSPSTESLKYEEDSDESSDEDDDDIPPCHHRTFMIGRSGRPRMWGGCPASISVSSNSSSSSEDGSRHSKKRKRTSKRAGVSFSDTVTVYPVFHSKAYPPSMAKRIYTKLEELRVNKIRSRKEFAYDMHDWRNATEEDDMHHNEEGKLIHPVHCTGKVTVKTEPLPSPCHTPKKVVQYPSAPSSCQTSGTVHRAKRTRMY